MTVSGATFSPNLPTTPGAFDETHNGSKDAFVARFDTTTPQLLWSTYLGGSSLDGNSNIQPPDFNATAMGLVLTDSGEVIVAGATHSQNFPTTAGAYQTTKLGPRDAFVSKLSANGSTLIYSTYFGGTLHDTAADPAVDAQGRILVSGYSFSTDLPTTTGALQPFFGGQWDGYLAVIDPAGNGLQDLAYCSYLGGSGGDSGVPVVVRDDGQIFVAGFTASPDFPHLTPGSHDQSPNGGMDAFCVRLDLDETGPAQLVYGTLVGGSGEDNCFCLGLRDDDTVVLGGYTLSSDFPTTPYSYDPSWNGGTLWGDVFVLRLDTRPPVGASYCSALPNSTGGAAALSACGSFSLTDNDFVLRATPVPNQPFLFFTGPNQIQLPFGDGFRCVGGTVTRIHPAGLASAQLAERVVDLNALGVAPGMANFQCWYRDPGGPGGSGFNLSDAVSVVFTP